MTTLLRRALTGTTPNIDDLWTYQGQPYPTGTRPYNVSSSRESGGATNYERMFGEAMAASGVVWACMLARRVLFSEARFQWRRRTKGRPGGLFGSPELAILETPWANGTTGDLLARMIDQEGLAGNSFVVRRGIPGTATERLVCPRPDWISIVMGSPYADTAGDALDLDAEVVGYVYWPGGPLAGRDPVPLLVEDVAHFAPNPDPLARYRGMSWLTPVLREIGADIAATEHKAQFFANGASPQLVVSFDKDVKFEQVQKMAAQINAMTAGTQNAYRTMYVGGGADVTVAGRDLAQLDFKATQGAGETRVAAAAGVHPAVLGLSEGLAGASLNSGNFSAARRLTADKVLRPLWRQAAAALSVLVERPSMVGQGGTPLPPADLWYDDRDIPFLREDTKDVADAQLVTAQAIAALVKDGFEPDSVVKAIIADDMSLLVHSGMLSVQLQDPTKQQNQPPEQGPPGQPPAPGQAPPPGQPPAGPGGTGGDTGGVGRSFHRPVQADPAP